MRCAWIEDHRDSFAVSVMCEVLEVSRSGYYAWRKRPESQRSERQEALVAEMRAIHGDRRLRCYGSPRMHRELLSRGFRVSENTVARLMKAHGLRSTTARKFKATTDSAHRRPVADNALNQRFDSASGANQVWLSDITYVPTDEGWLYVAAVEDLYTRKIVGWSMSERMTSDLVCDALRMAIGRELPATGLLAHSDRGSQYASAAYQSLLAAHGITCSMSGTGNCYDNAPMESFFASFKKELIHPARYRSRVEARREIFDYLESFYNRVRRHSALGSVSPVEFSEAA